MNEFNLEDHVTLDLQNYKSDLLKQLQLRIDYIYERLRQQYSVIMNQFDEIDDNQLPIDTQLDIQENQKHAGQIKSLIQKFLEYGVIKTQYEVPTYIIEAGSGTGMLSYFMSFLNRDQQNLQLVQQNLDDQRNALQFLHGRDLKSRRCVDESYLQKIGCSNQIFVLIERMSGMRHKNDRYIKANGEPVVRVCEDLEKVNLNQSFFQSYTHVPIIIIGKHVCGAATDICLNYVKQYDQVRSLGIALCCHSKSDGTIFVGKDIALQQYNIQPQFLNLMHKITSWQFAFAERSDPRKDIGFKSRKILDCLRIIWIQNLGWIARIQCYWKGDETEERWVLLANKIVQ